MGKVKLRLLCADSWEKAGTPTVLVNMFELIAHVEREGDHFAACVEGFDGQIETVGISEEEVIKDLFDGFAMMIQHQRQTGNLERFLEAHGIKWARMDQPISLSVRDTDVEAEITYVQTTPPVVGGFFGCTAPSPC